LICFIFLSFSFRFLLFSFLFLDIISVFIIRGTLCGALCVVDASCSNLFGYNFGKTLPRLRKH